MDLNKTLSTGGGFHTTGAGNVSKQISRLTRVGKYQNLKGVNIAGALAKHAALIRRGNFGYLTQRKFVKEAAGEQNLTISQKRNLKEIAKFYGTPEGAHEAREAHEEKPSLKVPVQSIEAKMAAKVAAREAVHAGQRPNQPVARINRVLATQEEALAPGAAHSVSINQVQRPGMTRPSDSRGLADHGTGLAGASQPEHGTGLAGAKPTREPEPLSPDNNHPTHLSLAV